MHQLHAQMGFNERTKMEMNTPTQAGWSLIETCSKQRSAHTDVFKDSRTHHAHQATGPVTATFHR